MNIHKSANFTGKSYAIKVTLLKWIALLHLGIGALNHGIAVAGDREHLAPGSALATGDQFAEQRRADAAAAEAVGDTDRISIV